MNKRKFILDFKEHFDRKDVYKIVFKMADSYIEIKRLEEVIKRFNEISKFIFEKKSFWTILVMWDISRGTKVDLEKCGFKEELSNKIFNGDLKDNVFGSKICKEDEIKYLFYENFSIDLISPLINSIGGYELGIEPSANISAYFLSFDDTPIFINLYDDRGMELLCNDCDIIEKVSQKFQSYLLK